MENKCPHCKGQNARLRRDWYERQRAVRCKNCNKVFGKIEAKRCPVCGNRNARLRRDWPSRANPIRCLNCNAVFGGTGTRSTPTERNRTVESSIIAHTNRERRKRGMQELQPVHNMHRAARSHSKHMAKVRKMAHEGIGDGTVASRAQKYGCGHAGFGENCYQWPAAGENGWNMGARLVAGWMDSPGHRRNILNRQYDAIGVGVARNKHGELYATQVFRLRYW